MSNRTITWEENDGSIEHCILIGSGTGFDAWFIYDGLGLDFGDAADIMAECVTPQYRRFVVESPDGSTRRYASLANAKRSVAA